MRRRLRAGWTIGFIAAIWLAFGTSALAGDVFSYQDGNGVIHFTNVPVAGYAPYRPERPLFSGSLDTFRASVPADNAAYDELIAEYADRYDVEPALVKAVIRAESGFNRLAVSPKGARGLMQLMPATARQHSVRNSFSPRENIHGGVKHLRLLIDRYGRNLPWVLAAYNAGPEAVKRYRGIPPYAETRNYVSKVLRFRRQYIRTERLASN